MTNDKYSKSNINKDSEIRDNRLSAYWYHCYYQLLMQCIWNQQVAQFQM